MIFNVLVVKYGTAIVSANSEEEALEKIDYMFNDDFSWGDLDVCDLTEVEAFDM